MCKINSFSHLSLEERRIILTGITNGSSKTAIAQTIGKDKSTVGKEIKLHRVLTHRCEMPLEYYRTTLIDSRQGVNLTVQEAKAIVMVIAPLLKQGLSPFHILAVHPELGISEKTLYNYIENDVFHEIAGITVMDLRRQVSRKIPKKISKRYKKRADRKHLLGRTYKDYQVYISENPDVFVTQLDTVYNNETNGPFIQTFKFVNTGVLFAIIHDTKTSESMKQGVDLLESILGTETFQKYVHVLLTDRGSEFTYADAMETSSDGTRRTHVFYCDPMQSGQI